jgi:hypothetical protein
MQRFPLSGNGNSANDTLAFNQSIVINNVAIGLSLPELNHFDDLDQDFLNSLSNPQAQETVQETVQAIDSQIQLSDLSAESTSALQHTEELEESIIISKAKNFIINKQNDEFKALFDEHQEEILNHLIIDPENDCSFTFLIFSLYHQNTEAFMIMFDAEKTKYKSESNIHYKDDKLSNIIFNAVFNNNHDVFDALVDFDKDLLSNNMDLILDAIEWGKTDFVRKILTLCEGAKHHKSRNGLSLVDYAMCYEKHDIFDALVDFDKELLSNNMDVIFNAIKWGKTDFVRKILTLCEGAKHHKSRNGLSLVDYAMCYDNHDAFDTLVDFDKELISNNMDEIFNAIYLSKPDFVRKILTLCEEAKHHKSQDGLSLVDCAMCYENIDVLKEILTAHENSATISKEFLDNFIYLAICENNFEAFKLILEKYPNTINSLTNDQDLLTCSLDTLYEGIIQLEFNYGSIDESKSQKIITRIDNQKKILGLILKTKFDLPEDSLDQNFETLIDFYSKNIHLKIGYSDIERVPMHNLTFLKLYKEKILEIAQTLQEEDIRESKQDIENSRLFLDLALQTVDFIRSSISIESGDQKINIYNLRLSDHASYFIFYSDKETKKLTHIALCDNWEIFESDKWKESSEYVGGIRKFKVESEIEATEEFFKNFIQSNSEKKAMDEFHKNIREKGLVDHENNVIISVEDLKKPELSIKTKKRSRGNCVYKSFKILCRFIANYLDDRFEFYQENVEPDLLSVPQDEKLEILDAESETEDKKSISSELRPTERQTIDGDMIFKKFKKYLTINAIKSVIKYHDKVEQNLKDPEIDESHKKFNEYLKFEIETLLDKVHKKAEKKIELNKSNPHDLRIHQEILEQLSFPKTTLKIREHDSVLEKRSR